MGRKCRVKGCLSDSRRPEDLGVTFHKVPFHADIRPKWFSLCKILPDSQSGKIVYVCSRHFRRNDFCTFKGKKYMLKQGVLPSMFPWTNEANKIRVESPKPKEEPKEVKEEEVTSSTSTTVNPLDEKVDTKKESEQVEPLGKSEDNPKEVIPEKTKRVKKKSVDSKEKIIEPEIKADDKEELKREEKVDDTYLSDSKDDSSSQDEFIPVTDFTQGSRVEVTDFSGAWYPAKIHEVDYTENEVFIEFDDPTKSNEWISMDSKRLRHFMDVERSVHFEIGERVMAMWKNSIKFPATIQKSLGNDTYEVLFDDNIPLVLKSTKISKANQSQKKMLPATPKSHPSPLFAPAEGSKQDRRDRKRKLNVAELFNKKRPRTDSTPADKTNRDNDGGVGGGAGASGSEGEKEIEKEVKVNTTQETTITESVPSTPDWICRWMNGEPVGTPSVVDTRRSVIVDDPKIPPGWIKHFVCRAQGSSAGKWDTVVISPEGKKFRSRSDVQTYLEKEKLPHSIDQFDFSLHLKKARSLGLYEYNENIKKQTPKTPVFIPAAKGKVASKSDSKEGKSAGLLEKETPVTDDQANSATSLKIIFENGAYKCPIEGCAKTFRKENLTQMHVKHYHPEYSKFIGSTPNVADLAYARTIGEPIEEFLPKSRLNQSGTVSSPVNNEKKIEATPKTSSVKSSISKLSLATTPVSSKSDVVKNPEPELANEGMTKLKNKESEIVKILTNDNKTLKDSLKTESKSIKISTNLASSPKIEKKDSPLHSTIFEPKDAEKREKSVDVKEIKPSGEHKPQGGIKTLLPVVRPHIDPEKKYLSETHAEEKPKSKHHFGRHFKRRRNNTDVEQHHRKRKYTKHDYDYYPDYLDTGSRSPDYIPYGRKRKTVEFNEAAPEYTYQQQYPPQQEQHPKHIVTETGEVIKIVTMKQEEIINCTCGYMEEDGLMIQCELCLCWQHAYCNNIEREDQVPEKYVCYICQNPLRMRPSRKYLHDQDWLKQGTLASASYHAKDEAALNSRFERLRRSHELSGNLRELSTVMHSLRVKLKIAENKDHPKFYLWSKPWPKLEIDNDVETILEGQIENKENILSAQPNTKQEPQPLTNIESLTNLLNNSAQSGTGNKQLDFGANLVDNTIIKNETESLSQTTNSEFLNILNDNQPTLGSKVDASTSEKMLPSTNSPLLSPKKETPTAVSDSEMKTKAWMDGGVMSGEVSDGEMISQALASEALANDLLSSPTSLNLAALTPSDIEKIQNTIDNSGALVNPCIPEPEAKIEPHVCRDNLLDNISHYQKLINSRMDSIEDQIEKLEAEELIPNTNEKPLQKDLKMKETLIMLLRDLGKMRKLAALY